MTTCFPSGVSCAQDVSSYPVELGLPPIGQSLSLSPLYVPPLFKGLMVYPQEPFRFDFIMDTGHAGLLPDEKATEGEKLMRYFLAALTIPEDELWVNLSPYEADRIIPDALGVTEMGRDMLAQDYLLKQLTASLMNPEEELGGEFWDRVHTQAYAQYGVTNIDMNMFHKIWIVPEKALVYENTGQVFILESKLNVMLEEDYKALNNNNPNAESRATLGENQLRGISTKIIREILIPAIKQEINHGQTFAPLRQIYHSMILATWYKQALQESLINQSYSNQKKTLGVDIEDKDVKDKIYQQYIAAFKQGVSDIIREDYDPVTQEIIPRKYFSGGLIGKVKFIATNDASQLTTAQAVGDWALLAGDVQLRNYLEIDLGVSVNKINTDEYVKILNDKVFQNVAALLEQNKFSQAKKLLSVVRKGYEEIKQVNQNAAVGSLNYKRAKIVELNSKHVENLIHDIVRDESNIGFLSIDYEVRNLLKVFFEEYNITEDGFRFFLDHVLHGMSIGDLKERIEKFFLWGNAKVTDEKLSKELAQKIWNLDFEGGVGLETFPERSRFGEKIILNLIQKLMDINKQELNVGIIGGGWFPDNGMPFSNGPIITGKMAYRIGEICSACRVSGLDIFFPVEKVEDSIGNILLVDKDGYYVSVQGSNILIEPFLDMQKRLLKKRKILLAMRQASGDNPEVYVVEKNEGLIEAGDRIVRNPLDRYVERFHDVNRGGQGVKLKNLHFQRAGKNFELYSEKKFDGIYTANTGWRNLPETYLDGMQKWGKKIKKGGFLVSEINFPKGFPLVVGEFQKGEDELSLMKLHFSMWDYYSIISSGRIFDSKDAFDHIVETKYRNILMEVWKKLINIKGGDLTIIGADLTEEFIDNVKVELNGLAAVHIADAEEGREGHLVVTIDFDKSMMGGDNSGRKKNKRTVFVETLVKKWIKKNKGKRIRKIPISGAALGGIVMLSKETALKAVKYSSDGKVETTYKPALLDEYDFLVFMKKILNESPGAYQSVEFLKVRINLKNKFDNIIDKIRKVEEENSNKKLKGKKRIGGQPGYNKMALDDFVAYTRKRKKHLDTFPIKSIELQFLFGFPKRENISTYRSRYLGGLIIKEPLDKNDKINFLKLIRRWAKKYEGENEIIKEMPGKINVMLKDFAALALPQQGGVDFNPQYLDLQRQGNRIDSAVLTEGLTQGQIHFDGLEPVVLRVLPVTDIVGLFEASGVMW